MSILENSLYNSVKQFREGRSWSQQELAEKAGFSRTGVSAIENGKIVSNVRFGNCNRVKTLSCPLTRPSATLSRWERG